MGNEPFTAGAGASAGSSPDPARVSGPSQVPERAGGMPWMPRWLFWTLVGLAAVLLVAFLIPPVQIELGVGGTPLLVVCRVTDETTGEPIRGARIHVHSMERDEGSFTLETDQNGIAYRYYPMVMSTTRGNQSRSIDKWTCKIPRWSLFWIEAPGYEPSEATELSDVAKPLREWRELPALTVPITLRKIR